MKRLEATKTRTTVKATGNDELEFDLVPLSRVRSDEIMIEVISRCPGDEPHHMQQRALLIALRAFDACCVEVRRGVEKVTKDDTAFGERLEVGNMVLGLSSSDPR